eukprot:TRINITY_DN8868_c0_g1_i7.p1 TRINITY_DN8868_c0_g1~~TRINITY_DN8868_c0_g1_i7.p1  ORF type:complete len:406 (-),score=52.61 TRINITY_DN8868_c0_g1_i7:92-1309(-)
MSCHNDFEQKNAKNEIKYLRTCAHPRVLKLHEFFSDEENIVIILEHMKGRTLYDRLRIRRVYKEDEAARVMAQVLEALAHMHSLGILHRDIKLDNLFMPSRKDDTKVVLADFDISCSRAEAENHRHLFGTPGYLAPELFTPPTPTSGVKYSEKSDVFALGVVLFTLLTGTFPFRGSNPREIYSNNKNLKFQRPMPSVSPECLVVLESMIEKAPEKRMTAAQLLEMAWIVQARTEIAKEDALANDLARQSTLTVTLTSQQRWRAESATTTRAADVKSHRSDARTSRAHNNLTGVLSHDQKSSRSDLQNEPASPLTPIGSFNRSIFDNKVKSLYLANPPLRKENTGGTVDRNQPESLTYVYPKSPMGIKEEIAPCSEDQLFNQKPSQLMPLLSCQPKRLLTSLARGK